MSVHGEKIIADLVGRIEPGARVASLDDEDLGTVEAIEHLSIKVNAPLSRDYWIKGGYLVSYDGSVVRTSFEKKDLGVYRMDRAEPADDPGTAGTDDVIPIDEQIATRRQMEDELARQRAERERRLSA